MFGVVNGVYYCGMERTEELSQRMAERNVPSAPLAPQFSMRPVSTKYSIMPIVDQRAKSNVPIITRPTYNVQHTFNPGTAQAPWSGFATQVNEESKLRNQFFALQRCEQPNYVPSSDSDMYKVVVSGRQERQPFPGLFETQQFAPFNPNSCNTGYNLFDNCTRQQLLSVSRHGASNHKPKHEPKHGAKHGAKHEPKK